MTFTTTITQKGQLTIPKEIREILGLRLGEKIEVGLDKKRNQVKLKPLPSLEKLAGSFKIKKPRNSLKIREYMESNYR